MKLALLMTALLITGCTTPRGFPPVNGITNFDRIDSHLYRGAQPNASALECLASIGVRTVINLRGDPWIEEAWECRRLGIDYIAVPLSGTSAPSTADVERILAAIESAPGAVFVHCQFGCDRTGTVVACYRIRHGETPAAALNDAEVHGMSKLECGMKSFIKRFK